MTEVFVHTLNGGAGKWSIYDFPFPVEAFAQLGDDLYIRTGDRILRVVDGLLTDHIVDDDGDADVAFAGVVQWPYVDFGTPGLSKKLRGFDLVASGDPSVSFGYDQSNPATFTTPYNIPPDTYTGGVIPMPLRAPTFSLKIDFAPGTAWSLQSAGLYLSESRGSP